MKYRILREVMYRKYYMEKRGKLMRSEHAMLKENGDVEGYEVELEDGTKRWYDKAYANTYRMEDRL